MIYHSGLNLLFVAMNIPFDSHKVTWEAKLTVFLQEGIRGEFVRNVGAHMINAGYDLYMDIRLLIKNIIF